MDEGDHVERALELAYGYLNARDRTELEMRRHLEARGLAPSEVERSIRILTEQGYIDDARFARLYCASRRELDHWGADRIRRGLLARGIDRALLATVLGDGAPQGELDRALELLRRRFPLAPRERRERERALGVLLRKGYEQELALDALGCYAREQNLR